MKSKSALEAELRELGISPTQVVRVDVYNPNHLDALANLDTERSIEQAQPGDCLNPWGATYLLASPTGSPIGFLALRVTNDGYLGVDAIYVCPEHRGQGYGYALTLVSQLSARLQRMPLVALQPLTAAGRSLMEQARITIKPIDPMEAARLQSFAVSHWQEVVEATPCKHKHAQSNRSACDKCVYQFARPIKRKVLEVVSEQIRLRTALGTAA